MNSVINNEQNSSVSTEKLLQLNSNIVDKLLSKKFHKQAISQIYPFIQERLSDYKTNITEK